MIRTILAILIGCGILFSDSIYAKTTETEVTPAIRWTFDDQPADNNIVSVSSDEHKLPITSPASVQRGTGVYGPGLQLSGKHRLRSDIGPVIGKLSNISIAAWVKPASFDRYNEIIRQECPQRVLLSFQDHGKILSLGLNVDGYVECDAPISPKRVLDANWHHCVATYDGKYMRVYLDGQLIGELERQGQLATRIDVPAYIGSSSGSGEFFQGGLDELSIYAKAISHEEILLLYERGIVAITHRNGEVQQLFRRIFEAKPTFAESLVASRNRLRREKTQSLYEMAGLFNAKMQAAFPNDYAEFEQFTSKTPFEFLTATDGNFLAAAAERVVAFLLEYQPLTSDQWEKLPPDQRAHWQTAEKLANRLKSMPSNVESAQLAEHIELLCKLGRQIQLRPADHEAVAPYITPHTPPVRNLTTSEAKDSLRKDWLHQAGGRPTSELLANSEIDWTRELAARICRDHKGQIDLAQELARLELLANRANVSTSVNKLEEAYFAIREIKRTIMLKNPVLDFTQVLLVDMPFPQGKEWRHETRHRLGYMAVPGARLLVLDGLSPAGTIRQLMPQSPLHGSFWRPDLSWDASRVLFCFKPHNEKSFHLYEIGIDGSDLNQLTDGPYDDLDPIYLPDGQHVLFSTTRGNTYVRCMPPTNAYVLARCDKKGGNLYLVSRNNEPDYLPSVMNDGRVVYTRWEYTDKPLWRAQGLWTMNPDGTQVSTLWGNQSVWPDLLKDARSIPGSDRVMFTGSAHHNWFSGSVGIIDSTVGFNFPKGITKVTADMPWPESGNGPVDPIESPRYHASGNYTAYYSPFPLSESDFLVSAERNGKFVLYLMDVDGNRELVYEGHHNILHAMPVRPRRRPPELADRVTWPGVEDRVNPQNGVLYSNNVYHGTPPALRGKAKYLRVWNIQPKTYTYWYKRPYLSTGPVVSGVQSEGVKRILGTVPIEPDGSVAFHAPSGVALHFQLLDGEYKALQTMRSFTGVMPGEQRGCLGCHEMHSRTPASSAGRAAWSEEPHTILDPPWKDTTVSYERYVRPILDKYCAKCHEGDGEAREELDLTYRPGHLGFDECYWLFTGRPSWGKPYQQPENPPPGWATAGMLMVEAYDQRDPKGYQTPPPMTSLSYRSQLVELASNGKHYGVKVDPIDLRRLIVWVDAMSPYRGEPEVREIPDPEFQGVDWLSIRPRIKSAPRIVRPGPVD